MTWIVDIDMLGVESAEPPDALAIAFDVTYPGETWCRSLVLIAPELAHIRPRCPVRGAGGGG
jgi:hypothetical protein